MMNAYTHSAWRGHRHARTLASADALPRSVRGCLTTLRRRMRDGEARTVSTREAGHWFGCAPGTAAKALRAMHDAGHIRYEPHGLTYQITMLPPPELRAESTTFSPGDRSTSDRSEAASFEPVSPVAVPQTTHINRSDSDHSINIVHESHEEKRPAPTPRALRSEPQPESAADPLVGTIYDICKIVPRLATVRQRGQVAQTAGLLASVGATPDDVRRAARWFTKHDWRGQKGETPTPALLREVWGQVPKREAIPLAPPRPTMPAEPDLTPAQLRAKLAALGITPSSAAPGWSPWGGSRE